MKNTKYMKKKRTKIKTLLKRTNNTQKHYSHILYTPVFSSTPITTTTITTTTVTTG